jgi:hypothetical protein
MDKETEDGVVFAKADQFGETFENADIRNPAGVERGDINARRSQLRGDGPLISKAGNFNGEMSSDRSRNASSRTTVGVPPICRSVMRSKIRRRTVGI